MPVMFDCKYGVKLLMVRAEKSDNLDDFIKNKSIDRFSNQIISNLKPFDCIKIAYSILLEIFHIIFQPKIIINSIKEFNVNLAADECGIGARRIVKFYCK